MNFIISYYNKAHPCVFFQKKPGLVGTKAWHQTVKIHHLCQCWPTSMTLYLCHDSRGHNDLILTFFCYCFFSIELIFCLSMYFFVIKLPYLDKMGLVYNCSVFCCVWYMFFKIKNIVLSSIHYNQLNITMFVISYHNSKSFCQYNSLRAHFIWHNSICPIFSMKLRNAGIFL